MPVQLHKRAKLHLPCHIIKKQTKEALRQYYTRVSPKSILYMTAALETLAAEMFEYAGDVAKSKGRKRISNNDVNVALKTDPDFRKLMQNVTIIAGGVVGDDATVTTSKGERVKTAPKSDGSKKKNKADKYQWGLARLASMGFTDDKKNEDALAKMHGNIARATSILV